jgi:hypothetical protein
VIPIQPSDRWTGDTELVERIGDTAHVMADAEGS